jgi:hypothetical protein
MMTPGRGEVTGLPAPAGLGAGAATGVAAVGAAACAGAGVAAGAATGAFSYSTWYVVPFTVTSALLPSTELMATLYSLPLILNLYSFILMFIINLLFGKLPEIEMSGSGITWFDGNYETFHIVYSIVQVLMESHCYGSILFSTHFFCKCHRYCCCYFRCHFFIFLFAFEFTLECISRGPI